MKLNTILQAIKLIEGYGNKKAFQLCSKLELASQADISEVELFKRINAYNLIAKNPIQLDNIKKKLDLAFQLDEKNAQNGISSVSIFDTDYPNHLRDLNSPPLILYYRGNKECLIGKAGIAIIGSRKASQISLDFAFQSALKIGKKEITVVSGLALGCDTAAHQGAIAGGGKTIAVLAGGVDNETIYPKGNLELAQNIIENQGCLVSEYPSGVTVAPYTFVERDRIQSGLSHTVFVVQTKVDGGSMQTYKFALDQNRRVACFSTPKVDDGFSGNRTIFENQLDVITIKTLRDLDQLTISQPQTLF